MENYSIYFADIETSGLMHELEANKDKAKLHNICFMTVDGSKTKTFHGSSEEDMKTVQKLFDKNTILVMHNGICYDKNALKFFGFNLEKVLFVDTLSLSWYLDLNRAKHGLESYGEEFGVPKPVIKDWNNLTQSDYDNRVQEDVRIQQLTYYKLKTMFEELYGKMSDYDFCTHKVVKYLNFKMEQLSEQQQNKIRIDVAHAKKTIEEIEVEIDNKRNMLKTVMPQVPEYSKSKRPAKCFKADGSLSSHGEKWKILCEKAGVDFDFDGEIKLVKSYKEPNPNSSSQVKDWLFSLGWIPKTFKFEKKDGEERKIPQVYVQGSGGQVCESIEILAEKVPELEHLVGLGVLSHRKACIQGFLDSMIDDGFIEAGAHGFTNTLRLKHRKPCVNLPSSRVLYGSAVRSCLIARDGSTLLGADLSSLENRIKFNLQLPYDKEYVYSQMSDDFDPHLEIAKEACLLTTAEVYFYKIVKEGFSVEKYTMSDELEELLNLSDSEKSLKVKEISEIRGKGKSANYACQYGAGAATVARTAGVSLATAKLLVKAYKKQNWSIEKIAKSQVTKKTSHGTYQLNPYNKIWYHLKTEKDAFSTLVQGTGAYILDCWLRFQFNLLETGEYNLKNGAKLLATFHDEQVSEISDGDEKEAERLVKDSIKKVNKAFNMEIPFDCDVQFGKTYADIH